MAACTPHSLFIESVPNSPFPAPRRPAPGLCLGHIMRRNRKTRRNRAPWAPLPHEIGTWPRPPAALVDSLDHCLGAVLHLAGHCPCHRVMAPVPVGTVTVVLALAVPRGSRDSVEECAMGKGGTVKIKSPTKAT